MDSHYLYGKLIQAMWLSCYMANLAKMELAIARIYCNGVSSQNAWAPKREITARIRVRSNDDHTLRRFLLMPLNFMIRIDAPRRGHGFCIETVCWPVNQHNLCLI